MKAKQGAAYHARQDEKSRRPLPSIQAQSRALRHAFPGIGAPMAWHATASGRAPIIRRMPDISTWGHSLRTLVEVVGTVAFALSGILAGARKRMDIFGISVLGFLAAFGGGTLRDVLLDRRPFFWVAQVGMLWAVLGLCVLSLLVLRTGRAPRVSDKAIQWADALGLGLFAATGVQYALVAQMPVVVAVMMGVVTGVFGGVMRDIACNEMPTAFADHRPYAVCAFIGGWVYAAASWLNAPAWAALAASTATTTGLRLLALRLDYRMPTWRV